MAGACPIIIFLCAADAVSMGIRGNIAMIEDALAGGYRQADQIVQARAGFLPATAVQRGEQAIKAAKLSGLDRAVNRVGYILLHHHSTGSCIAGAIDDSSNSCGPRIMACDPPGRRVSHRGIAAAPNHIFSAGRPITGETEALTLIHQQGHAGFGKGDAGALHLAGGRKAPVLRFRGDDSLSRCGTSDRSIRVY